MHIQRSIQVTSSNGWLILIMYLDWNNGDNSRDPRLSPDPLTASAVLGMLFGLVGSPLLQPVSSVSAQSQCGSGSSRRSDPSLRVIASPLLLLLVGLVSSM